MPRSSALLPAIERLERSDPTLRLLALQFPKERFRKATFHIPGSQIEITGANRLLRFVLSRCDGKTSIKQLLDELPARKQTKARQLLQFLLSQQLVCSTHELPTAFHDLTSNTHPIMSYQMEDRDVAEIMQRPRFSHYQYVRAKKVAPALNVEQSALVQLLARRESLASVPPEAENITIETLIDVCRAGYGNVGHKHKTVPSAGALWPLTLFSATPAKGKAGQYDLFWYDDTSDVLGYMKTVPHDQLRTCFVKDKHVLDGALKTGSGVIFVAADISRLTAKYGGRAYRFSLMEAGAVMQNMHLMATERRLTSRPYGGIRDDAVSTLYDLPSTCLPLIALLVGVAQP